MNHQLTREVRTVRSDRSPLLAILVLAAAVGIGCGYLAGLYVGYGDGFDSAAAVALESHKAPAAVVLVQAPLAERPLVHEGCALTHEVAQVTIEGRRDIDQPWPFRTPLTVWRCPLSETEDRLVWRHPETTQASFMTIDADARVDYVLAGAVIDLR